MHKQSVTNESPLITRSICQQCWRGEKKPVEWHLYTNLFHALHTLHWTKQSMPHLLCLECASITKVGSHSANTYNCHMLSHSSCWAYRGLLSPQSRCCVYFSHKFHNNMSKHWKHKMDFLFPLFPVGHSWNLLDVKFLSCVRSFLISMQLMWTKNA